MWTGLGVIFIICVIAWPIVKFVGMALIGGIGGATGQKYAKEQIAKAEEEEHHWSLLDRNRVMQSDYRQIKLEEQPTSVVIGEKYERHRGSWSKSKLDYEYSYTVSYPWFYWKRKQKEWVRTIKNYNEEHGYTQSVYEYIERMEFIDDVPFEEWVKESRIDIGIPHVYEKISDFEKREAEEKLEIYSKERQRQCKEYCKVISMLAHRYVCFGEDKDFREAFIRVLMQHRDIALKFIRECHAANEWRKDYEQIYDCDNYLKDFMTENHIKEKMDAIMGHDVTVPDDLRYYKPNPTDSIAANHIAHEREKRGWHREAAESELRSQKCSGASVPMLIALIIGVIWFFSNLKTIGQPWGYLCAIGLMLGTAAWLITLGGSGLEQEHAHQIYQAERDEENYRNPLPRHTDRLGEEYAKELYDEIMTHPAPYKYYKEQT